MRLPHRVRGVVIGLAVLVVGPVLAATAVSPTGAAGPRIAAVPSPTPVEGVLTGNHARIPDLSEPAPPTAVPAPTALARPAAVVVRPKAKVVAAPAAPPKVYPPGSVDAIIMAAAARWGVDGAWMIRIASCESGERPTAVSSNGLYFGLFQFLPSTFRAHGGTDIFDASQQADITANMLAHGAARSWPVCSKR